MSSSTPVGWVRLSVFDDLLTFVLIDQTTAPLSLRKTNTFTLDPQSAPSDRIYKIISTFASGQTDLETCAAAIADLPLIHTHLPSFTSKQEEGEFMNHLRLYLRPFRAACQFDISSTTRYGPARTEAAVTARGAIAKGTDIKYLRGRLMQISEHELGALVDRGAAFSVVEPDRFPATSVMFGPARCVNHDCHPNAQLVASSSGHVKVIARESIPVGAEITVSYGRTYFGEDNSACRCATCQSRREDGVDASTDGVVDTEPATSASPQPARSQRLPRACHGRALRPRREQTYTVYQTPDDLSMDTASTRQAGGDAVQRSAPDLHTGRRCTRCVFADTRTTPVRRFCPRCVRHRRIYKLEWPARKLRKAVAYGERNNRRTLQEVNR